MAFARFRHGCTRGFRAMLIGDQGKAQVITILRDLEYLRM